MERKLATVRRIKEILPIEGADRIELAVIDGWKVVVAKDVQHKVGDLVIYCEIDSFLPIREEFEFLRKSSYKKMGDQEGFRLRTTKMKGQISQGLILPISVLNPPGTNIYVQPFEGLDVTEMLDIVKYEPPVPAELTGKVKGFFPSFIRKTDEERVQTLTQEYQGWRLSSAHQFYATEKLDGCLFEGTEISMAAGNVSKVEDVKVGDEIVSFNHETLEKESDKVINVLIRDEIEEWLELELEDGTTLTLTGNHPVFLPNLNCYRNAEDLQEGDIILDFK
jgi:RNA ligase (TIGR02306 family)